MATDKPDTELVREAPDWGGRSPSQTYLNLLELVKTPDEWGRIMTYSLAGNASKTATEFRSGKRRRPPGRWEFTNGPTDNGRFGIWARYLGPDEPTNDNEEPDGHQPEVAG